MLLLVLFLHFELQDIIVSTPRFIVGMLVHEVVQDAEPGGRRRNEPGF